jgi:TRAP-type uncharacterized transport system substrate-binding protein
MFRRLTAASVVLRHGTPGYSTKLDWARRLRMLLRHVWLMTIASVFLVSGTAAVAYYVASQPTRLKIAVGPPESDDVRAVEAITNQLKRERSHFRLHMIVKAGPLDAAKAIDSGEVDLAVVRRDLGLPKDGAAIAILRRNVVVLFVPAAVELSKEKVLPEATKAKTTTKAKAPAKGKTADKSKTAKKTKVAKTTKEKDDDDDEKDDKAAKGDKIEKVGDLVGKRIGIIGRSQANLDLLKVILRQYGISSDKVIDLKPEDDPAKIITQPDQITIVHFDPNNVAAAIREAKVDAIMSVGPVSSTITASAISASTHGKDGPTFLSIDAAEAISQRHPIYEATEIKAGAFGGAPPKPDDEIDTISFSHYIVARRELSDQIAGDFAKVLFSIRQSLVAELTSEKSEMTSALKIEAPSTDKDATVAVHPGASAYFTGDQKTFFDRYGDAIFYGMMLLSFSGSALAGVVGFAKVDDRVRRLKALERLLELTKTARHSESIDALDEMQAEADKILGEMIQEVENDALDEPALMAFSVSLDQAQLAISERRGALAGHPAKA